jgi:hypothetical protein
MTPMTPGTIMTIATIMLDALSVRLPFQLKKIRMVSQRQKQTRTTSSENT